MRNAGLDEAQAGIKTAGRNIISGGNVLPGGVGYVRAPGICAVDALDFHLALFGDKTCIDEVGSGAGVIVSGDLPAECAGQIIVEEEIHGRDGQAGSI